MVAKLRYPSRGCDVFLDPLGQIDMSASHHSDHCFQRMRLMTAYGLIDSGSCRTCLVPRRLRAPNIKQSRIDALVLVSSFSNIVRPSVEFTAKSNPGNFREIGIFLLNSSDKGYGNGLNQDS